MSSAICFNLDQSKILSSGNGLSDRTDSDRKTAYEPSHSLEPSVFKVTRFNRTSNIVRLFSSPLPAKSPRADQNNLQ